MSNLTIPLLDRQNRIDGVAPAAEAVRAPNRDDLRSQAQSIMSIDTTALSSTVGAEQLSRFMNSEQFRAMVPDRQRELLLQLNAFAKADLDPQLAGQKREILQSILLDIAPPKNIHQGQHATCTVSGLQFLLCQSRPEEYVRIMRDLCTRGETRLAGGEFMQLQRAAIEPDIIRSSEPRRISERLFQAGTMQMGLGSEMSYDSRRDLATGTYQGQQIQITGLFKDQYERAAQQVLGVGLGRLDTAAVGSTAVIEQLQGELKRSPGALVEVAWAASGPHALHMIVVTKIDGDTVQFYNPQRPGEVQTRSLSWLKENIQCALVQDGSSVRDISAPPPLREPYFAELGRGDHGGTVYEVHSSPTFDAVSTDGSLMKPAINQSFRVLEEETVRQQSLDEDEPRSEHSPADRGRDRLERIRRHHHRKQQ